MDCRYKRGNALGDYLPAALIERKRNPGPRLDPAKNHARVSLTLNPGYGPS
jgi:hypothetical protein